MVGRIAAEPPTIDGSAEETMKQFWNKIGIRHIEYVRVVVSQWAVVVVQTKRIYGVAPSSPVITCPVPKAQSLAERVVRQVEERTHLLLPGCLQRIVIGIGIVSQEVNILVIVKGAVVIVVEDITRRARFIVGAVRVVAILAVDARIPGCCTIIVIVAARRSRRRQSPRAGIGKEEGSGNNVVKVVEVSVRPI